MGARGDMETKQMRKCKVPHLYCVHLTHLEIDGIKQFFCNLKGVCMVEKELAIKIIEQTLPKFAIFRVKIFGIWVKISIPTSDIISFLKGDNKDVKK